MLKQMGVWICQSKAVVVRLDKNGATTLTFRSKLAPKNRATGGKGAHQPYLHCSVKSRDRIDSTRDQSACRFLEEVSQSLSDADEVIILGPGETRNHLARELRSRKQNIRVVEPAGSRLSEGQLAARIMAMFGRAAPRSPRRFPGVPLQI